MTNHSALNTHKGRWSFLHFFKPSWYLDALLFWAVFSSGVIFILWLFNNTSKLQMRGTIQQQVLTTTQYTTLLLDPQLHFSDSQISTLSPENFLEKVRIFLLTIRQQNAEIADIYCSYQAGTDSRLVRPTQAKWENVVLSPEDQKTIESSVRAAQESEQPIVSEWKFLKDQILFFLTPSANAHEYSFSSIQGWKKNNTKPSPVLVLVFDAPRMRAPLAAIDTNTANVLTISILIATILSLLVRRRSIQRVEAVEQKLDALNLLYQRDHILDTIVTAADNFINDSNLRSTIEEMIRGINQTINADTAYFTLFPSYKGQVAHTIQRGKYDSIGIFPQRLQTWTPDSLYQAQWQRWKNLLENRQSIIIRTDEHDHIEEKNELKNLNILSIIILPIHSLGQLVGVEVFTHHHEEIEWQAGLIDALKLSADLIGNAITRHENESRLRHSSQIEALGRMASGVAHEFNNILHIITGNLGVLSHKLESQPTLSSVIDNIRVATQRASKTIDQLLRSTRRSNPELQPASLNELIEKTVDLFKTALQKPLDIQLALDPKIPNVMLDESLLQQVILNILLNARDAMSHQGKIEIMTNNIQWSSEDEGWIYCEIHDSGPGISTDILDSIFEPFFTTKPSGVGTGLGLWACRSVLEQHKGFIEAVNHAQGGAVFSFYLPIQKTEPITKKADPALSSSIDTHQTVIVADDEPLCLQLTVDMLKESGFKIRHVQNGQELLAVAREYINQTTPWIVSDWTMPGMSGEELVRDLRLILPQAKIIVTSGYLLSEQKPNGIDAVLKKPFQAEELLELMKQLSG